MALGYLMLLFVGMSIVSIVGTVLLFVLKGKHASDITMVAMTFYALVIAYLNATAQPINFITQQVITWLIGLIAVVGCILYFAKKSSVPLAKGLVAISVAAGIAYLFFS